MDSKYLLTGLVGSALVYITWLSVYYQSSPSLSFHINPWPIPSPMPKGDQDLYPTLKQECFHYENVTAENICCKMHDYQMLSDIRHCIAEASSNLSFTNGSRQPTGNPPSVNWEFYGDSHARYIFCAIYSRMNGKEFECRLKSFEGKWESLDSLLNVLPSCGYKGGKIEIRHVTLPFKMTFYRDVFLDILPRCSKEWSLNTPNKPTLIVANTGNHWMRKLSPKYVKYGIETAGTTFENHMERIAPGLAKIANQIPFVFKLQDDLQTVHHNKSEVRAFTTENIEYYNSVLRRVLSNTSILLWDSTLPLSLMYNLECMKKPRQSESLWWMCDDRTHVGYILLQQYADMVLNVACNKYMDFKEKLCYQ